MNVQPSLLVNGLFAFLEKALKIPCPEPFKLLLSEAFLQPLKTGFL